MCCPGGRRERKTCLSDAWAFDVAAGAWSEVATPAYGCRWGHTATTVDRRVAVFGGRHKEDDGDYDYFGGNQHSVWFYDVAGDAWEEAPALTDVGPAARDHHAAAYVDGGLYVAGGAGKGCELPNFKGSSLGRVPLVSADFWTSDHPSERSRRVDACSGTRARGTPKLKRR